MSASNVSDFRQVAVGQGNLLRGARLEQIIKNPVLPSLDKRAATQPEILRRVAIHQYLRHEFRVA